MTAEDDGNGNEETNGGDDDEGGKTTTGALCAAGPAGAGVFGEVKISGFGCRQVVLRHFGKVAFAWSLPHFGQNQATGALLSCVVLVAGLSVWIKDLSSFTSFASASL